MYYSRVPSNIAASLSDAAKMHSFDPRMTQFENDDKHIVFEFTSKNDKLTFDELAQDYGYVVGTHANHMQMYDSLENMIDAVAGGHDPELVLSEAVTKGMQKAYARMSPVMQCSSDDCNVTLPKYSGRYPSHCPACGAHIVKSGQQTKPGRMAESLEESFSSDVEE